MHWTLLSNVLQAEEVTRCWTHVVCTIFDIWWTQITEIKCWVFIMVRSAYINCVCVWGKEEGDYLKNWLPSSLAHGEQGFVALHPCMDQNMNHSTIQYFPWLFVGRIRERPPGESGYNDTGMGSLSALSGCSKACCEAGKFCFWNQ